MKNRFCILLTATIDPKGCYSTKRIDPKIREQDYITSLELWLSKTRFPIVFCENSNYDLENVGKIVEQYPGRVEIIQFDGNDYAGSLGKGMGEFKNLERAISESEFIKKSENIIKVTGRVYIENINEIANSFRGDDFIQYTKHARIDWAHTIHTVIFIFKPGFVQYLKKYANLLDDSKGMIFEKIFEYAVNDAKSEGHKVNIMKTPKYIGYYATTDKKYKELFLTPQFAIIHPIKTFAPLADRYFGKMGMFTKKKFPKLYKILKPYFPDKNS